MVEFLDEEARKEQQDRSSQSHQRLLRKSRAEEEAVEQERWEQVARVASGMSEREWALRQATKKGIHEVVDRRGI